MFFIFKNEIFIIFNLNKIQKWYLNRKRVKKLGIFKNGSFIYILHMNFSFIHRYLNISIKIFTIKPGLWSCQFFELLRFGIKIFRIFFKILNIFLNFAFKSKVVEHYKFPCFGSALAPSTKPLLHLLHVLAPVPLQSPDYIWSSSSSSSNTIIINHPC